MLRFEAGEFFDADIGLIRWGVLDTESGGWIVPARDSEAGAESFALRLNVDDAS
jgi:hypothetical protein